MVATKDQETLAQPICILDPAGDLLGPIPDGLTNQSLVELYRWMVRLRTFDTRAVTLQRQGRMGTYPPFSGQEACQVGSVWPLERTDWICPTYRDHGAMIVHGAPMDRILRYWRGDEWGSHLPGVNTLPAAIPIATQCLHAVGLAWAGKLQGNSSVAVAYFGDGATSEGDFHEALNFAGVFRLPAIFFCQNNRYAISVPVEKQTAVPIYTKAAAYGIPGVQVDGNDILAVIQVMGEAVDRARAGQGATLIEAHTYRYGPHTTADDPTRYRDAAELATWQNERDPITRLRLYLHRQGLWSDEAETELEQSAKAEVGAAVSQIEALAPTIPADMFDHVYPELPWFLKEQRADAIARREVVTDA